MARELLGFLRYAPQATQRVNAVRALCEVGRPRAVQHAVRWALRDPDDTVRAVAVQAGVARCETLPISWRRPWRIALATFGSSAAALAVNLGESWPSCRALVAVF